MVSSVCRFPLNYSFFPKLLKYQSKCYSTRKLAQWDAEYSRKKARDFLWNFDRSNGDVVLTKDEARGIARISLDNPNGKNALTGRMLVKLSEAVESLKDWKSGRLLILSGKNGTFCSGGDLSFVKQVANPENGYTMCRYMGESLKMFRELDIISIANVEGYALGGGAELSIACDFRAVHKDAKIGYVQAKVGVTPGWGTAYRLFELMNKNRALEMLCLGSVIDALEAKAIGLANFIYSNNEELESWIRLFESIPLESQKASKRIAVLLDEQHYTSDPCKAERTVFVDTWGSKKHLEALTAGRKHK